MLIKKDKLDKKLNSVHVLTNCLGQLNIGKDIGGIDGDVIIIIVVLYILLPECGTTVPPTPLWGRASLSHLTPWLETFFVGSQHMLGCVGEMAKWGLPWPILAELICHQKSMKLML